MYNRDVVELALLVLDEGMSHREAAELYGANSDALGHWFRDGPLWAAYEAVTT